MEADTDITSPSSVLGEALQNAARITTLPSITPSGTSEKTLASGVREYFLELAPDFIYHKALDTLPWHLFPCLDSFVVDSGVNRATKAVITPSAAQEATIVLDTSYAIWTTCSTNKLWLPPRSILHTAKICMVLQIMHRADLMHSFLAAGKTDASLPMIEDDLVHIIGHTSSAREFHTEQKRALVRDIPSDHHVDFAEEDLVPLRSSGYLGTGACGVVDIVQNVFSGSILARKVLTPVKRERRLLKRFFDSEISSLRKLKSHQHIVQYVGSYTRGASLALLLLPVADCSLREFLAGSRNPLDRDRNSHILFRCFGCLASALAYMHDHRSLLVQEKTLTFAVLTPVQYDIKTSSLEIS